MSTRARIISAAASLGILGTGWAIGTLNSADATQNGTSGTTTGSTTTASATTTSSPTTAKTTTTTAKTTTATTTTASTSVTSAATSSLKDGTYTGSTTRNQFGSWVVTVTIKGGKITDISSTTTANDSQSARINASAVPTLKSRVIAAQSSDVNLISGATVTSKSYLSSLQSALDKAAA